MTHLFCFCWSTASTLSVLSLLVSIATLLLAYHAYKRFLVKQAQQKQLDIVLDLIKQIHEDRNNYAKFDGAGGGAKFGREYKAVNLFDVTLDPYFNKNEKLFFITEIETVSIVEPMEIQDLIGVHNILNWNFFYNFYKNPLLPKSIAEKLALFNVHKYCTVDSLEALSIGGGFLIGNNMGSKVIRIATTTFPPLSHADTFQKTAQELKQAILKWLDSYGIKDINLIEN